MTATLAFPPVRDGYTFEPGSGIVTVELDGGASFQRLDVIGSPHLVNLQWILRGLEYTAFMAFFRDTLVEGSLPFLVELLADIRTLVTHKARCKDGRVPRLTANKGDAYFIQGAFEVERNPMYVGSMNFGLALPFFPPVIDAAPHALPEFQIGDQFRIIDAAPNPLLPLVNFDGLYTITGKPSTTSVRMLGGELVNPTWLTIDPGNVDAVGTIVRIPT